MTWARTGGHSDPVRETQQAEHEADRQREQEPVGVGVHGREEERRGEDGRAGAQSFRSDGRRGPAHHQLLAQAREDRDHEQRHGAVERARRLEGLVDGPERVEVAGGGGNASDCSSMRPMLPTHSAAPRRVARTAVRWPIDGGPSAARHAGGRAAKAASAGTASRTVPKAICAAEPEAEAWREEAAREHRRDAGEGDRDGDRSRKRTRSIGPGVTMEVPLCGVGPPGALSLARAARSRGLDAARPGR